MVTGLDKVLSSQLSIDDGFGTTKIWRIENYELVDWPEHLYGQFYAGDSFVIEYTYIKSGYLHPNTQFELDLGMQRCILYFWQGRDSTSDEKGASAALAAQLDEQMGGTPVQVRSPNSLIISILRF